MPDRKMIFTILLAGIGYWLLDSVIDAFLFRKGAFMSQAFPQSPDEIFMRAVIMVLLSITIYAVFLVSKLKNAGEARRQAEKALIKSKLLLQKTFDSISDVMMLTSLETRTIIDINEAGARIFGYRREEMIGKTTELLYANHIVFLNMGNRIFSALATSGSFQGETEMIRKNSEIFPVEINISEIQDENSREKYMVGIIRDITERVRIEKALKSSEGKYRSLVENALVGVYQSTIDGRFLYTNDTHAKIMGYSSAKEMLAEDVTKLYKTPEDREQLINALKQTGRIMSYEVESPAKNGEIKTVQISATLDGNIISGLVLDITEQKRLEEQLRQAQKMEAIGQLAGGIAHDFNNILSAVVGYSHMTLMKMKAEDPLRMNIDHILEASDRAATLTHSLLAFSRKQTIKLKPLNLNELLRRFDKFILRLIREDIELKTSLVDVELTVMADSSQIEQALMNLVTNARDAMPSGGHLIIKTGLATLHEERADTFNHLSPGDYAFISIEDTGIGMNPETAEKVFEPFFTTKETGKGTGLGLAMVYGIIRQHGGHINVESESGKGTTFIIYLPIYNRALQKEEGEECTKNLPAKGGSETLLIAEDDAALRKLSTILLKQFGYNVIEASDGQEALNLFVEHKDKIRLTILDAIMPKKNGREVYEEMKKLQPGIRAILVSGYTADIFGKDGIVDSEITFMAKPVMPSDLLNKIRELLDVTV